MYTEKTAAARAETQPACGEGTGQLPACGALAFPYVAMQGTDPVRYDDQEALRQGTLFPGLDLPFHKELRSRFPQVDGPLLELMALLSELLEPEFLFSSLATWSVISVPP